MANELWSSIQSWFLLLMHLSDVLGMLLLSTSSRTAPVSPRFPILHDSGPDVSMKWELFPTNPPPLGIGMLLPRPLLFFIFPLHFASWLEED